LVVIYLAVSGAWILLSDRFVAAIADQPETIHRIQTYKGWFFVAVTGALLGWLVRRDLRQIESATVAVRESESKFRTLVEQSLTGVYIIEEGRFVYVNPRLCTMFGYTAEEMHRLNPLDPVEENDRARVSENLRKRLKGEVESLHYSFAGRHKEGLRLEVEVLGTRTEFKGRPVVIGTALDVTARKLAEEQQRRLTVEKDHLIERLQLHYSAMPIGCIVTSPDLTVLDWNPAAERSFGFTRGEMMGHQPYGRIVSESSRAAISDFTTELLGGNETRSLVFENVTKSGSTISCEWHVTPLRDTSGRAVGLLAMVQDVTERLQSEAALRELSGRLLAAQDEERRRIARELHDTTAQQLAALSLNLSAISRLLTNPPPKVERILADSLNLVGTAAQEVRTTAYLLHPPLLEAAGLVGAVRDYASGFAKRSGIRVELELDNLERLPKEAELALFRVVQEGLANIHRHSGSASATIRLAREGGCVKLQLIDSGHGIPTQTYAALWGKPGAVGVGIAGMRERMHQLKGRLEIESGANGTTVSATLPVVTTKLQA
jgi:PAS domain S-box-containing protein